MVLASSCNVSAQWLLPAVEEECVLAPAGPPLPLTRATASPASPETGGAGAGTRLLPLCGDPTGPSMGMCAVMLVVRCFSSFEHLDRSTAVAKSGYTGETLAARTLPQSPVKRRAARGFTSGSKLALNEFFELAQHRARSGFHPISVYGREEPEWFRVGNNSRVSSFALRLSPFALQ